MGKRGPGAGRQRAAAALAAPIEADLFNRNPEQPGALPWQRPGLTRGERVVAFIESLPVTKGFGVGGTVQLEPFQRDWILAIYSDGDDGLRQVRTGLLSVARGNGKTVLCAGLTLAHASGAAEAQRRLARARPADPAHPYLARKRIGAERLWQAGTWLLVPMQDETGKVWNVQRIAPAANEDGGWPKIYLKGGRTHGLFWWAGKPSDRVVIGEGMGTVAAVRRATGLPVVAAMTADNLPRIASMIRAKRPEMAITIAADDDPKGHTKAREAASLVGASIAYPGSGRQ